MKVLIVEDNRAMLRLLRSIVNDLAEVFECNNGAEAFSLYEEHHPDWVFMDVRLKSLNGIEITRQIMREHTNARIVIVTNYDDERLRKSARTAGACGYVLKENLFSLREIISAAPLDQPIQ
jgi:two-component system response regulator DegU